MGVFYKVFLGNYVGFGVFCLLERSGCVMVIFEFLGWVLFREVELGVVIFFVGILFS